METRRLLKRLRNHKDYALEASPKVIEEAKVNELDSADSIDHPTKEKRIRLSNGEKKMILKELDSSSADIICRKYGISDRALRKWKKERTEIEDKCKTETKNTKTLRNVNELDDKVFICLLNANRNGTPITGAMLKQEALKINKELGGSENFCASDGWLYKWQKRKGVRSLKITGEKLSSNVTAAEAYKEEFKTIIATKGLQRALCFNMDESSLPFKEIPKRTLVPKTTSSISGMKNQQERLTIAACCNADGSFRLPLILIGKSKNPRCLNKLDKTKLPVWYRHQKNACMDKQIFEEWFIEEFVPRVTAFLKSRDLPPRVVLLIDNCRSHKFLKTDDVEVACLPRHVNSLIQPLDQGILQTLKLNYQKLLVDSILKAQNEGISMIDHLKTINIQRVIDWAAEAWNTVEPYTIYKSWNKIWPIVKTDAETQTDNELDSFPVLMSLDNRVGCESVDAPLTSNDYRICSLLQSLQKIAGYDTVDKRTLLEWLKNPKQVSKHWLDEEIKNQVDEMACGDSMSSEEEIFIAEGNASNLGNSDFDTPLEKATRYKNEGNSYFKSGKYDEAILSYNKAIETCPKENPMDLATFYQNRAAAYDHLKKYSAVKADCTKALELNPRYIKALQRRARALEHSKELVSVLEDVTAACILERFSNQSTLVMADRVLKQLGKQHAKEHMENKKPLMPSKHFIRTYFSSFSNDPIVTKLDQSETAEPNTGYAKAKQAVRDQKYDDVISYCSEDIDRPDFVPESCMEVLLLRATFFLLLGRHHDAIADLEKIINSESADKAVKVNALIKRASMYMQLEDPDNCFLDFERAAEIDPKCGDIYHHRGQVNLLLEKVNEAQEDFKKAVELNPNFGIAFVQKCYTDYRYAVVAKDMNKITSVMKDFESAFERFPDCAECYTLYAQILCDSQDYAKADSYFAKAILRDPENANIHVHRGLLQLQWNANIDKAIEYINKAVKLDDKCEFGYETLGTIEVQRGNLKEAIELFDKALALGRTEMELTHIFSLKDAAKTQLTVTERLGLDLSTMSSLQ